MIREMRAYALIFHMHNCTSLKSECLNIVDHFIYISKIQVRTVFEFDFLII